MTTRAVTPTGTTDNVAIAAALSASAPGDVVALAAGTYAIAASLSVPAGVALRGVAGTVLAFDPVTAARYLLVAAGATVETLAVTGPGMVEVLGDDASITGVTSYHSLAGVATTRTIAGFCVFPPISGAISGVTFEDCHAIGTDGFGFYVDAITRANTVVTDFVFRGCTATGCGAGANRYSEWITGIDVFEGVATSTNIRMLVEDCHVAGCYESGFHHELSPTAIDCQMIRCTSTGNGLAVPPAVPVYGAGFLTPPGWTLSDCEADGNYYNYRTGLTPSNDHAGDPLDLIRCSSTNWRYAGFYFQGALGDAAILSGVSMDHCAAVAGATTDRWLMLVSVTDSTVLDSTLTGCTFGVAIESGVSAGNTITYYLAPFRASPAGAVTGETIAFTETSENDGLTAWAWDFGDGSGSAAQHPTHAYPTAGVYPVTLAAGGNVVSQTITVVPGVSYGGARLSEADLAPLDHDPIANATDLHNGRVGLQGSPVSRKAWTINALADDRAEIEALAALTGQHAVLNVNGTEYPGTMIRPPMLETQLTPAAWAYQVGFVQETRR